MARRRRRTGLGGTPEHHSRRAIESFDEAERLARKAASNARGNECWRAFDILHSADHFYGAGLAHMSQTPRTAKMEARDKEVRASIRDAVESFRPNCVRKSSQRFTPDDD